VLPNGIHFFLKKTRKYLPFVIFYQNRTQASENLPEGQTTWNIRGKSRKAGGNTVSINGEVDGVLGATSIRIFTSTCGPLQMKCVVTSSTT